LIIVAARPADVLQRSVLVLLIDDHSCPFVSKKSWKKSVVMVQKKFKVQRVMARCAVRGGRPQDRKTTGFTKPLRLEFNFGKGFG
jgi:hypothetical protein